MFTVENNLIVFMNIGVPGTTGHDFDKRSAETNTIIWYGKPKAHSQQPRIKISSTSSGTTKHEFLDGGS